MINVNHQTLGGRVSKIISGREPLPWMLMQVVVPGIVWDRNGKRAEVYTNDHVVIQGHGNVAAYRDRVHIGTYVFATGQRVPTFCVANEARLRGAILLASVFQLQEDIHD